MKGGFTSEVHHLISRRVQKGPAITVVKSTTRIPARGGVGIMSVILESEYGNRRKPIPGVRKFQGPGHAHFFPKKKEVYFITKAQTLSAFSSISQVPLKPFSMMKVSPAPTWRGSPPSGVMVIFPSNKWMNSQAL